MYFNAKTECPFNIIMLHVLQVTSTVLRELEKCDQISCQIADKQ